MDILSVIPLIASINSSLYGAPENNIALCNIFALLMRTVSSFNKYKDINLYINVSCDQVLKLSETNPTLLTRKSVTRKNPQPHPMIIILFLNGIFEPLEVSLYISLLVYFLQSIGFFL